MALLSMTFAFTACDNSDDDVPTPATPATPTTPKSFSNVTFSGAKQWFSTSGTSNVTLDSATAKTVASTLDIGYTYDFGYSAPGFLDLKTRAAGTYYWSSTFYTPWSSVSKKIIWYTTVFSSYTATEFNAAKADQSKIGAYFSDTSKVHLTHGHPIWPDGTCIGGRNAVDAISQYKVFAFKRVSDGKRGLMKIATAPSWINSNLSVDIIIEN